MRQPIQISQEDVNAYAERAVALSQWLDEKATSVARHIVVPSELAIVAPIIMGSGLLLMTGGIDPTATCWGGCVNLA